MAGGAETPNIAALPAIARPGACESARGPDADRHVKLLIQFAVEESLSGAYSQPMHHLFARGVLTFSLMERTEIGEVSRAGRSGGRERCDHHGSEHDPAPPLVLYGGSSCHFGLCGEVDETIRPCGQILREFGVGLL